MFTPGKILVEHEGKEDPQERAGDQGDNRDERRVEDHAIEVPRAEYVRVVVQPDERDPQVGPHDDPAHQRQSECDQDGRLGDDGDDQDGGQRQEPGAPPTQVVMHALPLTAEDTRPPAPP